MEFERTVRHGVVSDPRAGHVHRGAHGDDAGRRSDNDAPDMGVF